MGWDGYANSTRGGKGKFKVAAKEVVATAGSVDGLLAGGALDCSACAMALEAATGRNPWDEGGWTAAEVRELAKHAYWEPLEDVDRDRWWAVLSARKFLDVCAEINTGMHFSF